MKSKESFVAAADLGGTKICVAISNHSGKLISTTRVATPRNTTPRQTVAGLLQAIQCCIDASGKSVQALGIGVPGQLSPDLKAVFSTPNIPALNGIPLQQMAQKEFGIPTFLENDARCFTLAECTWGAAKGYDRALGVTLGTGIGGGLYSNGSLEHGSHGSAGELGHIAIDPNGPQCGCGAKGCLEQYASGTALSRMARKLGKADSRELFSAAVGGSLSARKAFASMGQSLGTGLASACNLYDPGAIVVGGSVSASWKFFAPSMEKAFKPRALATCKATPILRSRLVEPGVMGAAAVAFAGLRTPTA